MRYLDWASAGTAMTIRAAGLFLTLALLALPAGGARAQELWLQIEAKPTLAEAEARARHWAAAFPDLAGFRLASGWYALTLGPYGAEEAAQRRDALRSSGTIPADSYIARRADYRQQFWPAAAGLGTASRAGPAAGGDAATTPSGTTASGVPALPGTVAPIQPAETLAQARAAEAALSGPERAEIQTALSWAGDYGAAIDGAFGPGTRTAIAAWQARHGHPATGVLTGAERAALLAAHAADREALGLAAVRDEEAGIEIPLPLGLVAFDRYDPPFARYAARDGGEVQVFLISAEGDAAALEGLYEAMQGLAIVPPEGERRLGRSGFVLAGEDGAIRSHTEVGLADGMIKGFTLVHPVEEAARMAPVLAAMQAGFRPLPGQALEDGRVPLIEAHEDLLAGLEVRAPVRTRSGFFIDAEGTLLTTAEAVEGCARITADDATVARVFADPALGVAVLRPEGRLAPAAVAAFGPLPGRRTEVAVAGYPYAEAFSAPVMTFGRMAESVADMAADRTRLSLAALPGDAGGPVFDTRGAVVGLLLPREEDGARRLPPEVAEAVATAALAGPLGAAGFDLPESGRAERIAPEELDRVARAMVVQIACWN